MPGPIPKPAKMRQRVNKTSTAATLSATSPLIAAPALPDRGRPWHPMTVAWWSDAVTGVWASPMAKEFDNSDVHGLYKLAALEDDFWTAFDPADRRAMAAEIRLQRQSFGLSPIDRRRLQWEIVRVDDATKKRRPAPVNDGRVRDSRDVLRAV